MKNLWKYLSTLGLMFVAVLCLGVGLKSNEKAEAAKDCDVYVTGGATYRLDGGSVGTIKGSGDANITIVDGSVYEITDDYATGASMRVTLGDGSVDNVNLYNGDSYGSSSGSCVVQQVYIGYGTFSYRSGNIKKISNYHGNIYFNKAPTQTIEVSSYNSGVGYKVAQVETADFDLSKINFTSLQADTQLEIQEIDGLYWIVIVDKPYKLTITSNIVGGASFTDYGNFTKYDTAVLMVKKGATVSVDVNGFLSLGGVVSGDSSMVSSGSARYSVGANSPKFQADGGFYVNNTTALSKGSSYIINEDTRIIYRVKQIKCTITFTSLGVLGNPARYSTTSSTTAHTSALTQYSIDVDTNSTIQVYQNKVVVGSTTVYVIFKSGQVYSSASITGVLAIYLPSSTSSQTVTITQDVRVIYQGKAKSFLAQGEEGEAPPEIQWGIEVVMRDEDKIVTKPAVCIVPSGNEIVVRKRHEI